MASGIKNIRSAKPPRTGTFLFNCVVLLCSMFLASMVSGQNATPSEYQVKAAFIYHFAQFVDWPPSKLPNDNSPFLIGILGSSPFNGLLERTVTGKGFANHPMEVKKFASAQDARVCQIVFISSSEKAHYPEIFAALRGAQVLTVGESDHFLDEGGIINFVMDGNRIRFQIMESAAKAENLRLSAKLLTLAWRPSP